MAPTMGDVAFLGPMRAGDVLLARDKDAAKHWTPGKGTIPPHNINNNAVFALFGIIGAAAVVAGIWFFFWAKNGGFYFKKDDWSDYKTTVLRRRGPNGTLLSNATPSTQLGGGSVYKDVDDGTTEDSASRSGRRSRRHDDNTTVMSGITAGASDILGREKRRRKREQREREKERKREAKSREMKERRTGEKSSSRKVGPDGALMDEEAEAQAKDHLRQYRHERPARVGGINKASEGSTWDGSNRGSVVTPSSAAEVPLISNRERTPITTPTKKKDAGRSLTTTPATAGIRKVYSTADKNESREAERIKAEARKLAEKGRAAGANSSPSSRRDFSWKRADDATTDFSSAASSSRQTGTEPSEAGTKIYKHPVHIPGTTSSELGYAEEKRKRRAGGGYRRERDRDL